MVDIFDFFEAGGGDYFGQFEPAVHKACGIGADDPIGLLVGAGGGANAIAFTF